MDVEGSAYAQNEGVRLLTRVIESIGPIFTIDDARAAAEDAGIALRQVPLLLHRLAASIWLARLKKGVYAIQSPLFETELHPYAIAAALVSPAAISHWSALAHHGFTTQIPEMVQASTRRAVVTPEMRSGSAYSPRGASGPACPGDGVRVYQGPAGTLLRPQCRMGRSLASYSHHRSRAYVA